MSQALKNHMVSLLILALLAVLAYGSSSNNSSGPDGRSKGSSSSSADLQARVSFTGTQFVITNSDTFDWTNVKLEVNSHGLSDGYTVHVPRIGAGGTYTVGAMQFAKDDGERFNPLTHKAQNLSVWCDTPNGNGFYYGQWQ